MKTDKLAVIAKAASEISIDSTWAWDLKKLVEIIKNQMCVLENRSKEDETFNIAAQTYMIATFVSNKLESFDFEKLDNLLREIKAVKD